MSFYGVRGAGGFAPPGCSRLAGCCLPVRFRTAGLGEQDGLSEAGSITNRMTSPAQCTRGLPSGGRLPSQAPPLSVRICRSSVPRGQGRPTGLGPVDIHGCLLPTLRLSLHFRHREEFGKASPGFPAMVRAGQEAWLTSGKSTGGTQPSMVSRSSPGTPMSTGATSPGPAPGLPPCWTRLGTAQGRCSSGSVPGSGGGSEPPSALAGRGHFPATPDG